MTSTQHIKAETRGVVRILTFDRPEALNAISPEMLDLLAHEIEVWERTRDWEALVLDSAGSTAFCAGADVKAAREFVLSGRPEAAVSYFRREYDLQGRLHSADRPVVALVGGLCMGAGMGLALNAEFALVADTATFAMPETAIGFFPDAGASHFLNRLPLPLARYLGMTGARLKGADVVGLGLASHLVAADAFEAIAEAVRREGPRGLPEVPPALPPLSFEHHLSAIEECFSADDVQGILAALRRAGSPWSESTLETLKRMSPHSLEVTLDLLSRARGLPQRDCLALEADLVDRVVRHPDFSEGIRAALVDRDKRPAWAPPAGPGPQSPR